LLLQDAGNESRQTRSEEGYDGCAGEQGAAPPNENYSCFTVNLAISPLFLSSERFRDQ